MKTKIVDKFGVHFSRKEVEELENDLYALRYYPTQSDWPKDEQKRMWERWGCRMDIETLDQH